MSAYTAVHRSEKKNPLQVEHAINNKKLTNKNDTAHPVRLAVLDGELDEDDGEE